MNTRNSTVKYSSHIVAGDNRGSTAESGANRRESFDMAEDQEPTLPPHPPATVFAETQGENLDMTAEDEEPTLPPHPPAATTYGQTLPINKRKRSVASQQLFSDSSDQPLFSSDDDPAAENYQDGQNRRKKKSTSLFDRSHRTFERQADSGVFMGSDASFDSIFEGIPVPPPAASRLPLPVPQYTQVPRSSQKDDRTPAEKVALGKIEQCIASETEKVDLSSMQLEAISNATIARISEIGQDSPMLRYSMPWDRPALELKLFLFNNNLTRVPKAIFNLEHLTVLSLRANRLTEIPPVILKMRNLTELTLSSNSLRYLPMELLELVHKPWCKLTFLRLFPNPFCQPQNQDRTPYEWHPKPGFHMGNRWLSKSTNVQGFEAMYRQRTPVQFMDTRHRVHGGPIYSAFRMDAGGLYLPIEDSSLEPEFPTSKTTKQVLDPTKRFSLVEIMLQKMLQHPALDPDTWREVPLVPDLIDKLEEMEKQRETGDLRCTVCLRNFVIAKAQWVEWWEVFSQRATPGVPPYSSDYPPSEPLTSNPEERLVPFLRQACSWNCVKDSFRGLGEPGSIIPEAIIPQENVP